MLLLATSSLVPALAEADTPVVSPAQPSLRPHALPARGSSLAHDTGSTGIIRSSSVTATFSGGEAAGCQYYLVGTPEQTVPADLASPSSPAFYTGASTASSLLTAQSAGTSFQPAADA